jgi:hypothetical protein
MSDNMGQYRCIVQMGWLCLADPNMAHLFLARVLVAGSFVFAFRGLEYIGIGIGIPRNHELTSLFKSFTT